MAGNGKCIAKILVVDDEREVQEIVEEFLTGRGYEVSVASNGEEALRVIEQEKPDVVLLDIVMPGMSGIETMKRIKELNEKTGVIVITAVRDDKVGRGLMELGAYDYITKPIDFDYLETAVLMKISTM